MFIVVVAAIFGLIFGSAINAFVWRLKVGRSWVKGRSICPECGHELAIADLVPVVSWLLLRGKCRYCKAPIKDHPSVEVATGVVFALSAYGYLIGSVGSVYQLVFWLFIAVLLMILAVYDARWLILPDKVMLPLIVASFIYALGVAIGFHNSRLLIDSLVAATISGGIFYALAFFSRGRAMGGGDIKLAFAMGLLLGIKATALAMFIAFDMAAVFGIAQIVLGRRSRKDQIPFGPFLVTATIIAFVFGHALVGWYLRSTGLAY